jgi:hypothetical protein
MTRDFPGHSRGLDLSADAGFADRFWSKVNMLGDCWLWLAHTKPQGYGQFTLRKGKFVGAHTVSWSLTYSQPIPAGFVICHTCDNPPCVNPAHLFLGTQSDNAYDSVIKGRANRARGTAHPSARLTEADVRYIRAAPIYRGLIRDLAADFRVSTTTIRNIRSGNHWRHVA